MITVIHITGASGSGTTTLGKAICNKFGYTHLDTDDYFWYPTEPAYSKKRPVVERQRLLYEDITTLDKCVISGSFCGWGDMFISMLDLVIYLWVPTDIRIKRLKERETKQFGEAIAPGGKMHEIHQNFIEYAREYEEGGWKMRSKLTHNIWLQKLDCPVLKIEGPVSVAESLNRFKDILEKK